MAALDAYAEPGVLPASEAGRISMLLGFRGKRADDDVALANRVSEGLPPSAADALGRVIGKQVVVGKVIPETTLRRARASRKNLSRDMSERLYEVSRVVDTVSRIHRGDRQAIARFLNTRHALLGGKTPLDMAISSSAGADAVLNLLRRAEAGFAV